MFIGLAYWHELGSRVHYSLSKPHEVQKESLCHSECGGYYDTDR